MFLQDVVERLTQLLDQAIALVTGPAVIGRPAQEVEVKLQRWVEKTSAYLDMFAKPESERLKSMAVGSPPAPWDRAQKCVIFLSNLIAEIENDEDHWDDVIYEAFDDDSGDEVSDEASGDGGPADGVKVFVGHGRSSLWAKVERFLEKDLALPVESFERESRTGRQIVEVLEEMLGVSDFAVLVLTAEDETTSGTSRARQNVVHEAGLFQGRLGFQRVALLIQEGVEEFSNVAGLQHIPFSGDSIEQTFHELRRMLEREGLISGG